MKNKLAPIGWAMMLTTTVLAAVASAGMISWWVVPYPFFLYMTYLTVLLLHGSKLFRYAMTGRIKKNDK